MTKPYDHEWLAALPERIQCQQDANDVFAAFELEANRWIKRRAIDDFDGDDRSFYPSHSIRIVTDDDVKRLVGLLGEEARTSIPMAKALNTIQELQRQLKDYDGFYANVREAVDQCPEWAATTKWAGTLANFNHLLGRRKPQP